MRMRIRHQNSKVHFSDVVLFWLGDIDLNLRPFIHAGRLPRQNIDWRRNLQDHSNVPAISCFTSHRKGWYQRELHVLCLRKPLKVFPHITKAYKRHSSAFTIHTRPNQLSFSNPLLNHLFNNPLIILRSCRCKDLRKPVPFPINLQTHILHQKIGDILTLRGCNLSRASSR